MSNGATLAVSKMPLAASFDERTCWTAVLARDAGKDGSFVYAVVSTGIFCRPSCPARRPARTRVRFFRTGEEAQQAGFRACLRCRPLEPGNHSALVEQICRFIRDNPDERLTLASLGERFALSPFHLQRKFKAALGVSPREYADSCRLQSLKSSLAVGRPVTDAIYEAGYGSSSRVYERSDAQLGMTPSGYQGGGEGAFIRYTLVDSPVGRMLVAATDKGVCSIAFGGSDLQLLQELRREYPKATIKRGDAVLRQWIGALLRSLGSSQTACRLPLDIRATAFQRRVWEHLQTIRYGERQSYAEVARALGLPRATRAVARACASNPVPIAIPCHRVVRSDGGLGGYRWGTRRKRQLLEIERGSSPQQGG